MIVYIPRVLDGREYEVEISINLNESDGPGESNAAEVRAIRGADDKRISPKHWERHGFDGNELRSISEDALDEARQACRRAGRRVFPC